MDYLSFSFILQGKASIETKIGEYKKCLYGILNSFSSASMFNITVLV